MKRRFFCLFILLLMICFPIIKTNSFTAKADCNIDLGNAEKLQEVILAALIPDVRQAVNDYYSEYFVVPPTVDSFASGAKIMDITVNDGGSVFTITLDISPYQGAHNSIGRDRIVILADQTTTKAISYEHLESYELLPWLNSENDLKKPYSKMI